MSCIDGAIMDMINSCENTPIGELDEIMYVFNADELTAVKSLTLKSLVSDLTLPVGKKGYKIVGFKKDHDAGHELVASDTMPNTFDQNVDFAVWKKDAATISALTNLDNVVIVVENKDKGVAGESAFNIFGLDTGLFQSKNSRKANENSGITMISMSAKGQRVPFYNLFNTDYATTKALLEALLIAQV